MVVILQQTFHIDIVFVWTGVGYIETQCKEVKKTDHEFLGQTVVHY